jgi:hypothetical protein
MVGLVGGAAIRSNRVAANIACHGGLLLAHFAVKLLCPVANGTIKGLLLIKRLGRLRNDIRAGAAPVVAASCSWFLYLVKIPLFNWS